MIILSWEAIYNSKKYKEWIVKVLSNNTKKQ